MKKLLISTLMALSATLAHAETDSHHDYEAEWSCQSTSLPGSYPAMTQASTPRLAIIRLTALTAQ